MDSRNESATVQRCIGAFLARYKVDEVQGRLYTASEQIHSTDESVAVWQKQLKKEQFLPRIVADPALYLYYVTVV